MAVADDLERARAALRMVNEAPFNAEAPPEALAEEITPTELHYVRSNFAVPTHDGILEIGGAVETSITLTVDDLRALPAVERAVTLECAGNGRLETRTVSRSASRAPTTAAITSTLFSPASIATT
jgi:DMSO/TMAO reductase YedYZ molybdopterin-dependent catalytic subunit